MPGSKGMQAHGRPWGEIDSMDLACKQAGNVSDAGLGADRGGQLAAMRASCP